MENFDLEHRSIQTIRFLSADGIQQANSGHPGLPMGTAALAYTIWMRHLSFNPKNPKWINRDRFILSGGHGSMLLYSLLHLTGFNLPLDELKHFRQWNSLTPGHPEFGMTPGVETTTGPLGQGFANGVGMAMAQCHLGSRFNQPEFPILDHWIFAIVTDGDLMEGVSSEVASLAGHLKLGKLIYLYDDNRISIDGSTDLTFTEDRAERFRAYGWQVLQVEDGNDVELVDKRVRDAKADPRPSLIICKTHIGYGLPTRQDTAKAHGEPPGEEELNQAKINAGWPTEPRFFIPEDVLTHFRSAIIRGKEQETAWNDLFAQYENTHPGLAREFQRRFFHILPNGWDNSLPVFSPDPKGVATRASSGKVINSISEVLPELVGGSADLTPSNNTWIQSSHAFQTETPQGRNIHFGVREHGMGSIVNGMAHYGGLIPYGATFLVFSDYMRPAIRLSAFSKLHTIWIFTHDSIGLGEDGPTHQPVEQLASLRAIPGLTTIRPADANEVTQAWKIAITNSNGPSALILSRQALPVIDRDVYASADGLQKGAYILNHAEKEPPDLILMASGSEVQLILAAGETLMAKGIRVRLVSFPSWELFENQDAAYREIVLPKDVRLRIVVEAGVGQGWEKWVGDEGSIISLERFGASAPYKTLFDHFGFTVDNVVKHAEDLLKRKKDKK